MICILRKPFFYCPRNLDLPAKLREHGEDKWAEKDLWRLYYVLWVIYRARWWTDKGRFVPLNGAVLQQVLNPRKAKLVLNVLLKIGVIETDNHYRVARQTADGKSKGYRFTSDYNCTKFRLVRAGEIDYERISKRLRIREEKELTELRPEHRYLFDCLKRVTICDEARNVIPPRDLLEVWPEDKEDFYERSIEFIQTGQWFFKVGAITGRVFTNVANLPRELRPYLRLDGRRLAEIDISACQPLLLSELYPHDSTEKEKFLEIVLSGNFYEILDAKLSKPYGSEHRNELKQAVFTQIFFDKLRSRKGKLGELFSNLFPVLYAQIVKIKTPKHEVLAQRLQRAESDIVIKTFVGEVMRTTRIPLLTIHDSVLTFPEHTTEVVSQLMRAVHARLAVIPNIKDKKPAKISMRELLSRQDWKENGRSETNTNLSCEYPIFRRRKRGYAVSWSKCP